MGMHVSNLTIDWTSTNVTSQLAGKLKYIGIDAAKVKVKPIGLWILLEGLTYKGGDAHINITPGPGLHETDWTYFHFTVMLHGPTHAYYVTENEGASIERTTKVVNKDKKLVNASEHNKNPLLPIEIDEDVEHIIEILCTHKWASAT